MKISVTNGVSFRKIFNILLFLIFIIFLKIFKQIFLFLVEIILLGGIIAFDLCMKDYLVKFLSDKPHMSYVLIDGFIDLYYSENTGAGFGMFKDGTLALTIVTAVVIVACLLYLVIFHHDSEWLRIPLVMISAGGIGNLIDRIRYSYVVDMFDIKLFKFAVFNVADSFVCIGVVLILIDILFGKGKFLFDDKKEKSAKWRL